MNGRCVIGDSGFFQCFSGEHVSSREKEGFCCEFLTIWAEFIIDGDECD